MLNAHFACGDGRCNENIALSTIHQIFHSEHDRLVDDITNTLNQPDNAALLAAYQAPHPFGTPSHDISYGFGDRLFQAARFVTEMEYQHLVFEEFARKMQPGRPAVPRLQPGRQPGDRGRVRPRGLPLRPLDARRRRRPHARTPTAQVDNSLPLLTAFLNPPEFFNDGSRSGAPLTRRSRLRAPS